jgi:hypothetical protein
MMNRWWTICMLAGLAVLTVFGIRHLQAARQAVAAAHARYQTTTTQVQRVIDLRAQAEQILLNSKPMEAVLPTVNLALNSAGVPSSKLRSIAPESDSALGGAMKDGGGEYRRQSIRLSLSQLTLNDLGGLLNEWRKLHTVWTPSRIELSHGNDRRATGTYDVAIVITTTYFQDGSTQ